ncbi:SIMPL domain-containing protein [Sphingobacterium arenae]|uniref:SIMPL domain-containing protein n=1 Tax=Sphingobacterium arenae TaxID=1280598 RepID=A0ABR7XYW9_9SPHI|nr:SIMPL domain-containing protein [Sphingobacterium arenae]MBD1424214.1 SIMPL domain-containing protein [Sphingobacterium arenae]
MKKIIGLILAVCMVSMSNAQTNNFESSRRVSTRGYAEKEVTPDIVYISISLREYFVDGNVKKKVDIETLEKQLYDAALAIGVKKEDFNIQNIYSYNYDSSKKKENKQLLQAKQYRIKVSNLNGLNSMLDQVDPKGVQNTSINGYDHSQKRQIEKELKVAAVQDARTNAEIIATATGDKIGKVLVINDNSSFGWNDISPTPRMYAMSAKAEMGADASSEGGDLDINVRPIKLTCNIDGVFELL